LINIHFYTVVEYLDWFRHMLLSNIYNRIEHKLYNLYELFSIIVNEMENIWHCRYSSKISYKKRRYKGELDTPNTYTHRIIHNHSISWLGKGTSILTQKYPLSEMTREKCFRVWVKRRRSHITGIYIFRREWHGYPIYCIYLFVWCRSPNRSGGNYFPSYLRFY
jgi:hypothetical protein